MKLRFRLSLLVEASSAIESTDAVAAYVQEAIDGWSGGGDADELRTIKVVGDVEARVVSKHGDGKKAWATRRARAAAREKEKSDGS